MFTNTEFSAEEVSMSEGVAAEFDAAQNLGNAVNGLKEDLGLEPTENFNLDDFMSVEEQEVLNSELDPESPEYKQIQELFRQRLMASAFAEATTWVKARAAKTDGDEVDLERELQKLMDLQEQMQSIMDKRIIPITKAHKAMGDWMERYNTWKASPAFERYPHKYRAEQVFFNGLNARKAEYHKIRGTDKLSDLWAQWNELKEQSKQLADTHKGIWTVYFNLINEELNPYLTTGETEDVDDFSLLANTQGEVMDIYCFSHIREMSEEDAPEAEGQGFWKLGEFLEDRKAKRAAVVTERNADDEAYLEALMADVDSMPVDAPF